MELASRKIPVDMPTCLDYTSGFDVEILTRWSYLTVSSPKNEGCLHDRQDNHDQEVIVVGALAQLHAYKYSHRD